MIAPAMLYRDNLCAWHEMNGLAKNMGTLADLFGQIQEGLEKQSRVGKQQQQEQKQEPEQALLPPPLELHTESVPKNEPLPLNDQCEDSEAGCITHASVIKELVSKRNKFPGDVYEYDCQYGTTQSKENQLDYEGCKPMKRKYLDEGYTTTDTNDSFAGHGFGNYQQQPMRKDVDELDAGHHVSDQFQERQVDTTHNPIKYKEFDEDHTKTDTNFVLAFGNYQHQPTEKDVDDLVGFANNWIETTNGKRRRSS